MVVYEKCMAQEWHGVEVKEKCDDRGRGVIAMRPFLKGEIIVDYHAREISRIEMETIMDASDDDDRRSDYIFCGPNSLFWDGSAESCHCHPQNRLIGRLINFAPKSSPECNAKPQFFQFMAYNKLFNTILLVAARDIDMLEEIRFDYGDNTCLEMFNR
jgi:hypothetical protein